MENRILSVQDIQQMSTTPPSKENDENLKSNDLKKECEKEDRMKQLNRIEVASKYA